MSHTPGPWRLESDEDGDYIIMPSLAGNDTSFRVYISEDHGQADINAILAVPDLITFAEGVLEYCNDPRVIEDAKLVLAIVRGESS